MPETPGGVQGTLLLISRCVSLGHKSSNQSLPLEGMKSRSRFLKKIFILKFTHNLWII